MCMAATYRTRDSYFGRNLDLEYSYDETVTVTPRNYVFRFREMPDMASHEAMIGMAYVVDGYPLYYDATNESGLSMAGLNFPGNADYKPHADGKDNITPFEFIPWVLGQCATVDDARRLLERINLLKMDFSEKLPLSPLHWIIADRDSAITVECVKEGLRVYDNPVGILTNNPPFDYHMTNLNNYMGVSPHPAENRFSDRLDLREYSRGMGGMGLPGDLSSASRFVKAAFTKMNSLSGDSESESISQFFHILGSVAQQRGCAEVAEGKYEITVYSSCCNVDRGIYYYTTYENSQVSGVDMHREDLDGNSVVSYPLVRGQAINMQN